MDDVPSAAVEVQCGYPAEMELFSMIFMYAKYSYTICEDAVDILVRKFMQDNMWRYSLRDVGEARKKAMKQEYKLHYETKKLWAAYFGERVQDNYESWFEMYT